MERLQLAQVKVTIDPDIQKLFLMGSPLDVMAVLAVYTIFVKKIGPYLMKDRKPFELKKAIIVYNVFQVLTNAYLVFLALPLAISHSKWYGKSGRCHGINDTNPTVANNLFKASYLYCLLKVLDLVDTVFFVLRKRYNQVSFLHFYHHLLVCSVTFFIFQYIPYNNNPIAIMALINSGVHVLVYFYYLMSAMRPDLKESISWKRQITVVQIVQFLFGIGWFLYPLSKGDGCGYSLSYSYFLLIQDIIFLLLFLNFYIKSYTKKLKTK